MFCTSFDVPRSGKHVNQIRLALDNRVNNASSSLAIYKSLSVFAPMIKPQKVKHSYRGSLILVLRQKMSQSQSKYNGAN